MIVLALMGFLVWVGASPPAGGLVPIMESAENHVPEGMDPGPFNSNRIMSGSQLVDP